MSGQLNGSVLTAFSILDIFSESRPVITTQDVATELEINTTTAYRFLRTLEVTGALVAVQRGKYRLGAVLSDLGERAVAQNTLTGTVQPHLNMLTQALDETTIATAPRDQKTIVIARARSTRPYAMSIDIGTALEAHCTANGKLWLATLPPDALEHHLSSTTRQRFTDRTIVEADDLERCVAEVRERGYADCFGEREAEISAVGVPVLNKSGRMLMGISVFGPTSHFTEPFVARAVAELQQTAATLKDELYGEGHPATPNQ